MQAFRLRLRLQLLQGWLCLIGGLRAQLSNTGTAMHHDNNVRPLASTGMQGLLRILQGIFVRDVISYALAAHAKRTSQSSRMWLRGRRLLPRRRCGRPRAGRLPGLLLPMPTLEPSLQGKPST